MYAAVVVVNYLAWILGVGDGLAALGLDYRLARIVAGACDVQRPAPAQTLPERSHLGPS